MLSFQNDRYPWIRKVISLHSDVIKRVEVSCAVRTSCHAHFKRRLLEDGIESGTGSSRLTCLSFIPSSNTSSMIVNLGIFPPCRPSSPSLSRSRGSNAILLPPSKAEPACWVAAPPLLVCEPVGESGRAEEDSETELLPMRRLERPVEVISSQ